MLRAPKPHCGSRFVDVADMGMLASNWQAGVRSPLGPSLADALSELGLPNISVPEPATCSTVVIGTSLLIGRRRSRKIRHFQHISGCQVISRAYTRPIGFIKSLTRCSKGAIESM
jgi:hypothetical protein